MKANKLFTLDVEVIQNLSKEKNASKLVNELLLDYFEGGTSLVIEEIRRDIVSQEQNISKSKQRLLMLNKKLRDIDERELKVKELFKDLPEQLIKDFKEFPKMTEETLLNRLIDNYRNYNLNTNKVIEAWKYTIGKKD